MALFMFIYVINKACIIKIADGPIRKFCKYYLSDLLCLLVVLPCIEILLIIINKEITDFRRILLISAACAFVWEGMIPLVNPSSVSDPVDVLCYIIGGITYWWLLQIETANANVKWTIVS
jgi:hypothetical protein